MLSRLKYDLTMADAARGPGGSRVDLLVVADMVERGARVLDVGCGDGELLRLLETRGVDGRGVELSREGVNECVAKGLAVVQGDADTDLEDYPDDAFDFVILSQTLQATRRPRVVLEHMLRIGRHAIVSFPNFGHWRIRLQIFFGGHMPRTDNLPYAWYETPNIHFCSIKDFRQLCQCLGRQDGAGGGAQCVGRTDAAENAVVVLESVRRAGGIFAEPAGLARFSAVGRARPVAGLFCCIMSLASGSLAPWLPRGPVAQWSELAAHNRLVGGSSPPGPTTI